MVVVVGRKTAGVVCPPDRRAHSPGMVAALFTMAPDWTVIISDELYRGACFVAQRHSRSLSGDSPSGCTVLFADSSSGAFDCHGSRCGSGVVDSGTDQAAHTGL